jgi:hypothetical protein
MRYKTATYQRVKNLGNESERLEITIEISEDDHPDIAIMALKQTVIDLLNKPVKQEAEHEGF